MSRLLIVIPGNPGDGKVNTTKTAIVVKGRVRYVKSRAAREFAARAKSAVMEAAREQPQAAAACRKAVTLGATVKAYWERERHLDGSEGLGLGDVDAPIKAALDAIEHGGVVDDDVRFIEVIARKAHDPKFPRIEVEVYPLTESDA